MWIAPQAPPEEASQKNGWVGKKRLEFVGRVEGISHGGVFNGKVKVLVVQFDKAR